MLDGRTNNEIAEEALERFLPIELASDEQRESARFGIHGLGHLLGGGAETDLVEQ